MKRIKRGEIYSVAFPDAVGSEQGGRRPMIIIQNDLGNRWSPTVIVSTITSKMKKTVLPTHVKIDADFLAKDSIVLLEQIKTIDKSRLGVFLGKINNETMMKIDKAIRVSLGV